MFWRSRQAVRMTVTITLLVVLASIALDTSASALAAAPGWEVTARTYPTNLPVGGSGLIAIDVYNVGAAASSGTVTVTDTLPPGLTATDAGEVVPQRGIGHSRWDCSGTTVVTCTNDASGLPAIYPGDSENPAEVRGVEQIGIAVKVAPSVSGMEEINQVAISGGGAPTPASVSDQIALNATPAGFGFAGYDAWFTNADGTSDTQAGSHPYEMTVAFDMNAAIREGESVAAGGQIRRLAVNLPPGLVGDPSAVPQCTRQQFDAEDCPATTQIGVASIGVDEVESAIFPIVFEFHVYNMVPPPGSPAQFAVNLLGVETFLDAGVRSGGDYGITEHVNNIAQREIVSSSLTIWGEPADPSHDPQRCELATCGLPSNAPLKPFLTLPTSCAGPQRFSIEASPWENASIEAADEFLSHDSSHTPTGFTGCDRLVQFSPSIEVAPDTSQADAPTGLTVDVRSPQGQNPEGLATSGIKDTTVVLPEGLVINPGQAAGLLACQPAQEGLGGETDEGPPECPAASEVGTVEIETPLLKDTLKGDVYVLQSNPPDLQLLLAASADGVNLKLVGEVHLNETTGRLTTTFNGNPPGFEGTPNLPFTELRLAFSGGAQAALVTPTTCGKYTSNAAFTPWSSPFTSSVLFSSSFPIVSGASGSPCTLPLPFSPSMIAGATTDQAGGFTNFSLLLQRGDGQQRIDGLQFKAPPGLTGELAKVPLCSNEQAETNTCPEASKIGHTVVESGPGPYPLVIPEPGQEPAPIYLTGPYNGSGACNVGESGCAPFGLSVVVPLHVGPFVLPTQRVRAKIEVNPLTAALTITTNPLPQVVAGVPTDVREVDAVIEHPEFMINPTNCNPSEFTGTAYGTPPPGQGGPGATAPISSHFRVGACRSLEFAPNIVFSTNGKTSKQDGADLITKVTYPSAPQGTYANIGYVKVELPKALPSRLTTLQKACTDAQFEANPAGCPPESKIGYATVHTPLLPVPLTGPAIFVSHGGEAFPSLTMVLQGYGVTVDLVGTTFISKAGITSTTFKTVPDQPFSSFELVLPQGPYSALAAYGNLCTQNLVIPNEFISQAGGAPVKQDSTISVTGCAPAITVVSHKVKGKTATIQVRVPGPGRLAATAKGLTNASKTSKRATTLTVKLTLTNAEVAFLGKHKTRKLKARVNLQFTPTKGGKLKTSTTVIVG
jgi:hypothetical protein